MVDHFVPQKYRVKRAYTYMNCVIDRKNSFAFENYHLFQKEREGASLVLKASFSFKRNKFEEGFEIFSMIFLDTSMSNNQVFYTCILQYFLILNKIDSYFLFVFIFCDIRYLQLHIYKLIFPLYFFFLSDTPMVLCDPKISFFFRHPYVRKNIK